MFESIDLVRTLMAKTSTKTGLRVFVKIIDRLYQTGRKYAEDFKENMSIVFDDLLPQWTYIAIPTTPSLSNREAISCTILRISFADRLSDVFDPALAKGIRIKRQNAGQQDI